MGRLFSMQVPVELAKAVAKAALIGTVLYLFLDSHLGRGG